MKKTLSIFLLAASLIGCSAEQTAKFQAIEVQVKQDANIFCKTRDQVLPFIQTGESFASVLYPPAAALVVLDQTMINPGIKEACAVIGGVLVAPPK